MHLDAASLRELVAGPGTDTRAWFAYAIVQPDQGDQRSVTFDTDGPKVLVKFMPSGIPALCAVLMGSGGDGEGEYHPFVANEEVCVAFPEGNEHALPLIVGRKSNEIDRFPTLVAGNDVTQNNFAFKRVRAPYVFEVGSSYLLRSAPTGSFLAVTEAGAWTLANADKALLQLGADVIGFRNGDADCFVEIHVADKRVHIEAGDAKLQLASGDDGIFFVPGTLTISTAGAQPIGHGVTVEQVWAIVIGMIEWLLPVIAATGAVPGGGSLVATAIGTALTTGFAGATPILAAVTGAASLVLATIPGLDAAIRAELATAHPTGVGAGIPGLQLG